MEQLQFIYNDGGRSRYFKATGVGDCVTRAFAIATKRDYKEMYNLIKGVAKETPRDGVKISAVRKVAEMLGARWVPTMKIGQGCKVHLAKGEVPEEGNIVCQVSNHLTAVINGVINDTYNPSRGGNRCVYGYWIF